MQAAKARFGLLSSGNTGATWQSEGCAGSLKDGATSAGISDLSIVAGSIAEVTARLVIESLNRTLREAVTAQFTELTQQLTQTICQRILMKTGSCFSDPLDALETLPTEQHPNPGPSPSASKPKRNVTRQSLFRSNSMGTSAALENEFANSPSKRSFVSRNGNDRMDEKEAGRKSTLSSSANSVDSDTRGGEPKMNVKQLQGNLADQLLNRSLTGAFTSNHRSSLSVSPAPSAWAHVLPGGSRRASMGTSLASRRSSAGTVLKSPPQKPPELFTESPRGAGRQDSFESLSPNPHRPEDPGHFDSEVSSCSSFSPDPVGIGGTATNLMGVGENKQADGNQEDQLETDKRNSNGSNDSGLHDTHGRARKITDAELMKNRMAELIEHNLRGHSMTSVGERVASPRDRESYEHIDDAVEFPSQTFSSCGYHGIQVASPYLLRACGILPWSGYYARPNGWWRKPSAWYQWLVFLIALSAVAVLFVEAVAANGRTNGDVIRPWNGSGGLLCDLPLAVGAALSLGLMWVLQGSGPLCDCLWILQEYARRAELIDRWQGRFLWDAALMLGLWVSAVLSRAILGAGSFHPGILCPAGAVPQVAFVVVSGLLLCIVLCLTHACQMLTVMVDTFCLRIVGTPNISEAMHEWNILHAVLCKTSGTLEHTIFALQVVASATLLLGVADVVLIEDSDGEVQALLALLPGAFVVLGVLRLAFCAAGVTDKCERVPALINGLSFGNGTNRARQYLVQYILNSSAGFYVLDVRLTMATALKYTYLWAVVAFGLISGVLRS